MKVSSKIVSYVTIFFTSVWGQGLDEMVSESRTLIQQGEFDKAEQVLLQIIQTDENSAEAHYLLSRVAYSQGDLKNTGTYLRNAIGYDPGNTEYRSEYDKIGEVNSLMADGNRKLSAGDFEAAVQKFEQVQEKYPDFVGAYFYIGLSYYKNGEVKLAAENFRTALEVNPGYDRARKMLSGVSDKTYNSANQSFRRGDYDLATEEYNLVLELDPEYYKAEFQLGAINTRLGDYESAVKHYSRTIEINPEYAKAWFALGLSYQKNNDIEKALESLQKAVEVDPTYAKAHAQIGTIFIQKKEYDQAEDACNLAIQSDPSYAKPYNDLGKIYVILERWDEAVNTLSTGTSLNEKDIVALALLAQANNALNQFNDAKRAAHIALEIKGNFGHALYELGMAEINLGNKTAALNAFEKARNDRTWRKSAEYELDKIKHPEKYKD